MDSPPHLTSVRRNPIYKPKAGDIVKERKPQASYPRRETEARVMHSSKREDAGVVCEDFRMQTNASQESWESAPCSGLPFSSTKVYYTKEYNKP